MKSSGLLVFYLSETEDADLWQTMTRLTPDERAVFFKRALRQSLGGEQRKETADVRQKKSINTSEIASEISRIEREIFPAWAREQAIANQLKDQTHPLQDLYGEIFGPAEMRQEQSREPEESAEGQRGKKIVDLGEMRSPKPTTAANATVMATPGPAGAQLFRGDETGELDEISLDELILSDPFIGNQSLKGRDFLLKNIIGEENDEAVLEVIKRAGGNSEPRGRES